MGQAIQLANLIGESARLSYRLAVLGRAPLPPFDPSHAGPLFELSDRILMQADRIRALEHGPINPSTITNAETAVGAAHDTLDTVDDGTCMLSADAVIGICDAARGALALVS